MATRLMDGGQAAATAAVGVAALHDLEDVGERMEALERAYGPQLRRYCASLLRNVADADADDAAQEAILSAAKAMPRFRREAQLWPWLSTIAKHACWDVVRTDMRSGRLAERLVATGESVTPTTATSDDDPDEAFRRRARARWVAEAMRLVPATYRRPLYMREFEGRSYAEIAELEGRSLAAVRTSLMRGRKALALCLETLAKTNSEWSFPGFLVASAGLLQRLRARSRALLVRAAVRVGVVPVDGGPLSSAGFARMTEVLATMVALGALLIPGGGGDHRPMAGATQLGTRGFEAAILQLADNTTSGGGSDAPPPHAVAPSVSGQPVPALVPSDVLPPAPHKTGSPYQRKGEDMRSDMTISVPLPGGKQVDVFTGDTGYDCDRSDVWQTSCDVVDRLPQPPG
jgi:RNA polymerase sigma-70 factor (ECF subfamily)